MIRLAIAIAVVVASVTTASPAQGPMATSVPEATPTAAPSPPAASSRVTLAFVGDLHFERHLRAHLEPAGLTSVQRLWEGADFVMGNLETAITSRGTRQEKIYTFRAPARTVPALAAAGVTVVSMANNHALDFGRSGLKDTLAAFAGQPIAAVGIGATRADALRPFRIDIPDRATGSTTPLSVFAVATSEMLSGLRWAATDEQGGITVWESHRSRLLAAIRAEHARGRVVIVYVHWGREGEKCPTSTQRRVAHDLEQAGAKIIVGAHPHVLQGIGSTSGGALVAYSLGNFIWYNPKGGLTGVLQVELTDGQVSGTSFTAARLSQARSMHGLPRRVDERAAVFASLAACADLS